MIIVSNLSELKKYFTDDNLLEQHGGTSKYKYSYPFKDEREFCFHFDQEDKSTHERDCERERESIRDTIGSNYENTEMNERNDVTKLTEDSETTEIITENSILEIQDESESHTRSNHDY